MARNPATNAKIRTRIALMKNDLEQRGHPMPRKSKGPALAPRMRVGEREFPTFVVMRGEDYRNGGLSFSEICRSFDSGTVFDILDYVQDRDDGVLPEPNFAVEVMG